MKRVGVGSLLRRAIVVTALLALWIASAQGTNDYPWVVTGFIGSSFSKSTISSSLNAAQLPVGVNVADGGAVWLPGWVPVALGGR